jgi:hypothetical protein
VITDDLVAVGLTDAERRLLILGFGEWGGPARCTEALAIAMGFLGVQDLDAERRRIGEVLRAGQPLSRKDWRRALISTEIAFASDVFGSGVQWSTTTGLSDAETIVILRSLQYKLAESAHAHGSPPAGHQEIKESTLLRLTINAPLRPDDRGRRYADPLQKLLDRQLPGSRVSGGGTPQGPSGETAWCDIDVEVIGDPAAALRQIVEFLELLGAPKGCTARLADDDTVTFGRTEGVAVYLNGTDLPAHVYAETDVNVLIRMMRERLGSKGRMQSFWEGPRETALYFYGVSAATIRDLITPVLAENLLAQNCRVVDLPHTLPR